MKMRIPRRRKTIGAAIGLILATGVTMAVLPGTAHAGVEVAAATDSPPTVPGAPAGSGIRASVISGQQIYKCTQQDDGSFAFKQDDVAARLELGINHSF